MLIEGEISLMKDENSENEADDLCSECIDELNSPFYS
jgi:hypothetical protein